MAHKISISRREAKEAQYWLQVIIKSHPEIAVKFQPLEKEANELVKILSVIGKILRQ